MGDVEESITAHDSKDEMLALAEGVIASDAEAVQSLMSQIGSGFWDATQLLLKTQGKVITAGLGTSGATARRIAHLLSVGGTPSLYLSPADALHGSLGAVTEGDTILAVSKGGESDELNAFVRLSRDRGAQIVSITGDAGGTLSLLSDVSLVIQVPEHADPGGMIAMGSALAACAIGDALVVVLMKLRQYPWERFEETHPGGAVGKAIRERGYLQPGSPPSHGEGGLSTHREERR